MDGLNDLDLDFGNDDDAPITPENKEKGEEPDFLKEVMDEFVAAEQPVPPVPVLSERDKQIQEIQRANPVLVDSELSRAKFLQQTLSNLIALYAEPLQRQESEAPEAYLNRCRAQQAAEREQINLERDAGVFGPATRKAYERYVTWLQSRAVPEAVREMDSFRLPVPAGCPLTMPADRLQRSLHPDLYRAMTNSNELKANMALDTAKVPTEAQMKRLEGATQWLESCNKLVTTARAEHDERRLNLMISDGLPQGWKRQPGEPLLAWRSSAAEMIDLASRTRNYIEAMQSLAKLDKYQDMKISLPQGTVLVMERDGKTFELNADNINEKLYLFKKGTVKSVRLDLPEDLRQENPANAQKIERLRGWLAANAETIEKGCKELTRVGQDPDSLVMYGDQEIRNGKAIFNAQGEFTGLAKPGYTPKAGERVEDINLCGYDFEIEPIADKPGKFRITQTITAERAPWYAYQNFRALGVEKLGVKRLPPIEIDGNDFVPVRNGDKIEMIKANRLQGYRDWQQFAYYGEKGLVATMDVAMCVSGTIEIGAAVRGARIAATAANAGLRLEGTEAAFQLTKGLTRVTVGGAGILNGAGGRDLKVGGVNVGEHINTARGLYFLGDVSLGLARGGWGLFKTTKAAESLTSAEKVHSIIHGRQIGSEVLKGIPFVKQVHTGSTYAFKATEYAFAPVIASELKHQVQIFENLGKRDAAIDAPIQIGDGRGLQAADKTSFNPSNKRAYDGTCGMLDSYKSIMTGGKQPETKAKLEEIFSETKRVLGPGATAGDRQALAAKLIANVTFTGEEIKELEKAFPYDENKPLPQLTAEQLSNLRDPEKRKDFPKEVRELAERLMAAKDKDVAAASEVALLFIARDAEGKIGNTAGELKISVPKYDAARSIPVREREVTVTLSTSTVVADLKKLLEAKDGSNRGIVIGDTLVRIEALTHQQYAGTLQDVLKNPHASRESKLASMSDPFGGRLATIADGVRYQESLPTDGMTTTERDRSNGRQFGLSSSALMATLENTAKSDPSADVRALAAAQLYALREGNPRRRAELLSSFNTMQQNLAGKPDGEMATQLREFLRKEMQTPLPTTVELADAVKERQLNAALMLSLITSATDKAAQREINLAIARTFTSTDPKLTMKVVDAMLPDRIKQLQTDDPQVAHEFRTAVVALVKIPDTYAKEEALVAIIGKMEPLLKEGDVSLRTQLKMNLEVMLTRESQNYAEHFPSLRSAAITALATMGSQSSLDLIRSHVAMSVKLKVGDKELNAGEQDARVRMAAAKALLHLQDPEMRSYIGNLIDKENDASVATVLRDFSLTEQRPDRDSLEYKRIYEQTMARLIDPFSEAKYPHLKGFNETSANELLDGTYDLLKFDTFQSRAKKAVDDTNDWSDRRFTSNARLELLEYNSAAAVFTQKLDQWKALQAAALTEGVDGDKARKTLYYMMWATPVTGRFGSEGLHGVQSENRDEVFHKFYNFESRGMAAAMLRKCCEPGCKGRDLTASIIEDVFTTKLGGSATDQMGSHLLGGLKKLHTGGAISRERMAEIYARALENELKRPAADQREWLQSEIVKELRGLKYRMMYPAFEALAERSPYPAVKQGAADALAELRDSVPAILNEAPVDPTTSAADRAARVGAAIAGKGDSDKVIQTIFNSYKGYSFDDPKDPGLAHLTLAMKDPNARVRAAAAFVLVESKLPNNHPAKALAIATLGMLAKTSFCTQYQKPIFDSLTKIKLEKPIHLLLPGNTMMMIKQNGTQLEFSEFPPVIQRNQTEVRHQTMTVVSSKPDPANPGRFIVAPEQKQVAVYVQTQHPYQPNTTWAINNGATTRPVTILQPVKPAN